MRPPDPCFADPRLAVLYDDLDGERDDLDAYVSIADEVGAQTVIDVGCGTGCLALLLADSGHDVAALDPAGASLDVARAKPGADRVTWLHGDATVLDDRGLQADLAMMTGNVAMVFVDDEDWRLTLRSVRNAVRPGGWLVFETRQVEARDWERWETSPTVVEVPSGRVTVECTVTDVSLPLVTFEAANTVAGERIPTSSTLRFRSLAELGRDLAEAGFEVVDVREAPDRPGLEHVVIARRT